MGKCGASVYGFEIGNEINKYGSWDTLKSEWESFAAAIVATPGALLAGPGFDAGGSRRSEVVRSGQDHRRPWPHAGRIPAVRLRAAPGSNARSRLCARGVPTASGGPEVAGLSTGRYSFTV